MNQEAIEGLRGRIRSVLNPLIRVGARCALLDFPDHPNVGDSAIWLGEMRYLRERGARVVYHCDIETYSKTHLKDRIGNGTILLHGGGNFGTVWPRNQELRERIVQEFPNNPIVQLPQTIHFSDRGSVDRARRSFGGHGGVTLLVRDNQSLAFARGELSIPTELCPDCAFMLGSLSRTRVAGQGALVLARTDIESSSNWAVALSAAGGQFGTLLTDWLVEPTNVLDQQRIRAKRYVLMNRRPQKLFQVLLGGLWREVANRRLRRGIATLCRGRVVVTDRLHAHILAVLLGLPNVMVDNSYGKLRSFFDTWTREFEGCYFSDSPEAALEETASILKHEPLRSGATPRSERFQE